jgi:hypothetical protein
MLRWQQAESRRHALDAPFMPRPGEMFRALCGAEVTPGKDDFVALGGKWLDATCWDCERVWREIENFPADEFPPLSGRHS